MFKKIEKSLHGESERKKKKVRVRVLSKSYDREHKQNIIMMIILLICTNCDNVQLWKYSTKVSCPLFRYPQTGFYSSDKKIRS